MPASDPRTALLVVDVQNDFADPVGSLAVAGGHGILPYVNERIREARTAGTLVIYTQDWHPEHTPHFAQDGGIWPVHCVGGTWGAAFHPDLLVDGPSVRKGSSGEDGYSGFTMRDPVTGETEPTELPDLLRVAGIGRVEICGLATDYCVLATALDAVAAGYETLVHAAGIAAVDLTPGDGQRALEEMRAAGVEIVES
jgi:nicotinamidase/pyrazinamidase